MRKNMSSYGWRIYMYIYMYIYFLWGFPGGPNGKNLPANTRDLRDVGWIPGLGRSPGGGYGNPLRYSCLENPMDKGAWQATVHRVAQSWTWLKWLSRHKYVYAIYIYSFSYSFPLWFIIGYWIYLLVLYSRTLFISKNIKF